MKTYAPRPKPLGKRFPLAPAKFICGIPHVHVACGKCRQLIWANAANTRAICRDCSGELLDDRPTVSCGYTMPELRGLTIRDTLMEMD